MKLRVLVPALAVLAACSTGPQYRRPDLDVPSAFRMQQETPAPDSIADSGWWELYRDPALQTLIRTALEQNRDVRIATARIDEARALVGQNRLAQFPQVNGSAGATRARSRVGGNVQLTTIYDAQLGVSYELDLWRRLASLTEAARADLLATVFAREAVRISLIANVATAYFDLATLDQQLNITRRTVATRQRFLDLTQSRFRAGVASGLDVSRAEASLALARANLPDLERQIAQTENLLQVLLGQNPGPVVRSGTELAALPTPPDVPAGLPSALLARRPDLRQAEYGLTGANARVRAARAALFPDIPLTGSLGVQSLALSRLFTGPTALWSIGFDVVQPILNANRNAYLVEGARAREEQALLQYQQSVAQAFREVADALAARRGFAEFRKAQEEQVRALEAASRRVLRRYEIGFSSYFEVVDADRDLFNAELLLVQADRNTRVALVQLYRALGGGWESGLAPPPPASPSPTAAR